MRLNYLYMGVVVRGDYHPHFVVLLVGSGRGWERFKGRFDVFPALIQII